MGHDLHTKYWDFRCYLKENQECFLKEFEEKYYFWGEELQTYLWNDFEFNLANIAEDILFDQMYESTGLGLEMGNTISMILWSIILEMNISILKN